MYQKLHDAGVNALFLWSLDEEMKGLCNLNPIEKLAYETAKKKKNSDENKNIPPNISGHFLKNIVSSVNIFFKLRCKIFSINTNPFNFIGKNNSDQREQSKTLIPAPAPRNSSREPKLVEDKLLENELQLHNLNELYPKFHEAGVNSTIIWRLDEEMINHCDLSDAEKSLYRTAKDKKMADEGENDSSTDTGDFLLSPFCLENFQKKIINMIDNR